MPAFSECLLLSARNVCDRQYMYVVTIILGASHQRRPVKRVWTKVDDVGRWGRGSAIDGTSTNAKNIAFQSPYRNPPHLFMDVRIAIFLAIRTTGSIIDDRSTGGGVSLPPVREPGGWVSSKRTMLNKQGVGSKKAI